MITQDGKNYYSLEEIRNYIESQDSRGDIHYNLNDENMQQANRKLEFDASDFENDDPYNEGYIDDD